MSKTKKRSKTRLTRFRSISTPSAVRRDLISLLQKIILENSTSDGCWSKGIFTDDEIEIIKRLNTKLTSNPHSPNILPPSFLAEFIGDVRPVTARGLGLDVRPVTFPVEKKYNEHITGLKLKK